MKKRILAAMMALALASTTLTGCGSASSGTSDSSSAVTGQSTQTDSDSDIAANSDSASESASSSESGSGSGSAETLADGVYTATFTTDSSMFHVNEAYDDQGTLTVEDGKMTIHVSLASENIVNLYEGTAEDAQKEGAQLLEPTTDTVTYDDGTTEEVYGFDIPVPAIDEEFDLALIGTKGKWYDHKVKVTDPKPLED